MTFLHLDTVIAFGAVMLAASLVLQPVPSS